MLELRQDGDAYQLGYGGDVFNTAVYAARSRVPVSFLTATGQDAYSEYLIQAWQSHQINTSLVRQFDDATPALYAINLDANGERSFTYWRDASPVKRWLEPGEYVDQLQTHLKNFNCLYFSGITLAILPERYREKLIKLLGTYRQQSGLVAFDTNYRPKLWQDSSEAKLWLDKAYAVADIALPSIDDERLLRDINMTVKQLISHISELGCGEVVVKQGEEGVFSRAAGHDQHYAIEPVKAVDTTAAGDAFNGAYLAARLNGLEIEAAVSHGAKMARQVIQKPGAIVDTN